VGHEKNDTYRFSLETRTNSIAVVGRGLRDKDIGPLLGLTTRSVTRVVREICDKLNASTRTQAACVFMSEQKARIDWEIENPAAARSV